MTSRATQAELLEQRIAENRASQEVDLVRWIFERIPVQESDQVLELCCGTGGQTLRMLSALGKRGRLYALDLARVALTTLVTSAAPVESKLVAVQASLVRLSGALRDC